MKRKSSFVLLVTLLLLGCAPSKKQAAMAPLAPVQPVTLYTLVWQRPVSVEQLTLTLQKVEDTRCPKDVRCIWAGVAVAQVRLEDSAGASVAQTLSVGKMVNVPLGAKKYGLTLREITPYPQVSDLNPEEKAALVSLTAF
ncbi:hypothetical protein ACFSC6_21860 [Rufibacter sediminis]|uniref:Lipoprotein n=1 Tax=Rufibacter sediminis TaxID=2762756 RepID=A0ABR6VVZ8_9BACT|nr:hypothetical protein [Rufibacter sediminis]MBC3540786.1 hypothetical protein [Rufibacter sediminis]